MSCVYCSKSLHNAKNALICILVIWELNVGFVEVTSAIQMVQQRRMTGLSMLKKIGL